MCCERTLTNLNIAQCRDNTFSTGWWIDCYEVTFSYQSKLIIGSSAAPSKVSGPI